MTQSQISIPLSKEQAFALVDAVMEHGALADTASAHESDEGEWIFEATCATMPDVDAFNEVARQVLGGAVEFALEPIDPDFDWVARSLEGLQPVSAGGFYIHGGHYTGPVPGGLIGLRIDAAQAFGTGHHETTTGCLEAISLAMKRRKPRHMLDVGTGTGVLAIAMAKRTRLPVVATDIDPVAVQTAAENARINGVVNEVITLEAAGLDHPLIADNAPYDMIVANILAGPLASMAPDMRAISALGGTIILSGILEGQAQRVLSAYRRQGLVLKQRIVKKDWVTLILEQSGLPAGN